MAEPAANGEPEGPARLSFKEMCARFDVTPRTLRYYEYIELLSPRKEGRARSYGPREVARMTLILRGRKFGFALEEIRQWLSVYENEGTEAQMRRFLGMADRQLAELAEQRRQLDATMAELAALRDGTARSLGASESPRPASAGRRAGDGEDPPDHAGS